MNKSSFSMIMTDTQKQLLEELIDLEYPNLNVSRASYILELIRTRALSLVNDNLADDYYQGKTKLDDESIYKLILEFREGI